MLVLLFNSFARGDPLAAIARLPEGTEDPLYSGKIKIPFPLLPPLASPSL